MAAAAEARPKSIAREYYEALLIAIIFVNFARIFVFQAFKIPSGSMEDNLKIGDHIIVNKFVYGPHAAGPLSGLVPVQEVRRGDIVVFRAPPQPEDDFVKRVVGLPGETIAIRDKVVYVNDARLDEPYAVFVDEMLYPRSEFLHEPARSRDQMRPFKVPEGQYFVMGDNRDYSHDSRYWGAVPRTMIKGRAFMVYWSFDGPPMRGGTVKEQLAQLAHFAVRFFPDTRWSRTFFFVDSVDHYTPGVSSYGTQ